MAKRSAMYRSKCPLRTTKQQLYNGTVIGFLCHVRMQSTCDQVVSTDMLLSCMCQKKLLWNTLKTKTSVIPVEPLLLSPAPKRSKQHRQTNKKQKKSKRKMICTFISQEREADELELETSNRSEGTKFTTQTELIRWLHTDAQVGNLRRFKLLTFISPKSSPFSFSYFA